MHPTHWLICAQVVARPADNEPQLEAGTFEDGEAQDPGVAEAPSQRLRGRRPLRGVRRARRHPRQPPRAAPLQNLVPIHFKRVRLDERT